MNPFQSDNIWKKKALQGKAQQHPLTPQQEWQKQVNSSSLWLGGGETAVYQCALQGSYVGTQKRACVLGEKDGVWQKASGFCMPVLAIVLIVVVGCFCVYTAASLGRLMKNKPEEKAAKKKKKAQKE